MFKLLQNVFRLLGPYRGGQDPNNGAEVVWQRG